jgi:hypothetical protein
MESPMSTAEKHQEVLDPWDIQFFLMNPTDFPRLDADGFRIALVTNPSQPFIEKMTELLPSVKRFFENVQKHHLFICLVRTRGKTAHNAICKAQRLIEHYIDSLAVAGFCVPGLAPGVVVRRGNESDAQIMQFYREKWLEGSPSTTAERESWNSRSEAIMQHLLPVLSELIEKPSESHTELAWRALYSAKLFRRGIESRSFGIEFFCKFAALENLVVGGETVDKGKKFRTRLGTLVGKLLPNSESVIAELWNRRHPLVHEARLEFIDEDPSAFPVHVHTDLLNWLFQVTFVFLSDHFESAASLNDLWPRAETYHIPDKIRDTRPQQIARFAASSWTERSEIVWKGAGKLMDDLWAASPVGEGSGNL